MTLCWASMASSMEELAGTGQVQGSVERAALVPRVSILTPVGVHLQGPWQQCWRTMRAPGWRAQSWRSAPGPGRCQGGQSRRPLWGSCCCSGGSLPGPDTTCQRHQPGMVTQSGMACPPGGSVAVCRCITPLIKVREESHPAQGSHSLSQTSLSPPSVALMTLLWPSDGA
jgi:hypothetical protein